MRRLSIIITLYKSEPYIRKCLESIYAQDLPVGDYEIVVVDDGSPDKSADIVEQFAQKYGQIKLIRQKNKGLSEARNVGLRHAEGKYLRFVDPDDYIESTGNAALLKKMDDEDLDMLRFDYTMVDEDYRPLPDPRSKKYVDYQDEIIDGKTFLGKRLGYACFVWAFIYKTRLIKDNSLYFLPAMYFDDIYWLPEVLMTARKVTSVSDRQIFYLQRSGSLIKVKEPDAIMKKIEGQILIIEHYKKTSEKNRDACVIIWYRSMLAHSVITVLKMVALHFYKSKQPFLRKLKEIGVYPLSIHKTNYINRMHVLLINISPKNYCWLIKNMRAK